MVRVDSRQGEGTEFQIYFPLIKAEKSRAHLEHPADISAFRDEGLVLLIDDEEPLRKSTKEALMSFGYDLITAADGMEGVVQFKKHYDTIDLVILDMAMPVMSGRETYIEIRKINPPVKVILSSGFRQDRRVQEIIDMGASAFLQKPYSLTTLIRTIQSVTNR
jgi:CheY-like chemotaxis protein